MHQILYVLFVEAAFATYKVFVCRIFCLKIKISGKIFMLLSWLHNENDITKLHNRMSNENDIIKWHKAKTRNENDTIGLHNSRN